jgi:hypothetical protein
MDVVPIVMTVVLLAASPVGDWCIHRHPAVRNDA